MNEVDDILAEWVAWAKTAGHSDVHARIDNLGVPHQPTALPRGWQGVYGFRWGGAWLKIGKAGPNSNARWQFHHYGVDRAMSTLAFSLIRYGHLSTVECPLVPGLRSKLQTVGPGTVGDWMKQHTERVNFLVGAEAGSGGLGHLETIAHRVLSPVFEGRWKYGGELS